MAFAGTAITATLGTGFHYCCRRAGAVPSLSCRGTLSRKCSLHHLDVCSGHAPSPRNVSRASGRLQGRGVVVRAGAREEFGWRECTGGAHFPRKPAPAVTKWALLLSWIPVLLASGEAHAAAESIGSSGLGIRIAEFLRGSGWADEAIVFTIAMLPVLELRGAVPISYWLQVEPWKGSLLAILGNMVPVPLILLYLGKLSDYLSYKSPGARTFFLNLFERTRRKAGPIEEFKWVGLMLFVAVPFPGTGAWTGAIAAYVLGMPFWNAVWANFFGVVIAGILVNLLVSLGLKSAMFVGALLFLASTFMWSYLRKANVGQAE